MMKQRVLKQANIEQQVPSDVVENLLEAFCDVAQHVADDDDSMSTVHGKIVMLLLELLSRQVDAEHILITTGSRAADAPYAKSHVTYANVQAARLFEVLTTERKAIGAMLEERAKADG